MKVYVAGPYSKGDVAVNVRTAIAAADALAARQFCPYLPHLTHFWHLVSPKLYEWWLEYDSTWLLECDAVLRLSGESNGADEEVKLAETAGIPVVFSIDALEEIREKRIEAQRNGLSQPGSAEWEAECEEFGCSYEDPQVGDGTFLRQAVEHLEQRHGDA